MPTYMNVNATRKINYYLISEVEYFVETPKSTSTLTMKMNNGLLVMAFAEYADAIWERMNKNESDS